MSEENLKGCAHCGNDAMLGKGHLGYYVVCRCISPKKTREEIIKAWNTRQSPESKDEWKDKYIGLVKKYTKLIYPNDYKEQS